MTFPHYRFSHFRDLKYYFRSRRNGIARVYNRVSLVAIDKACGGVFTFSTREGRLYERLNKLDHV